MSIDSDIAAAFSSAPAAPAPSTAHIDPEITAAFQPEAPKPRETQKSVPTATSVVRRNPSMVPSSLPSSPASATDLAAAGASGVNSAVVDLAGIPMNTATNASNLIKAAIGYPYSKVTGKAPPSWLQADDPANVPGTSEWLKAKTRQAGGSALIDAPRPNGQDLSALHTVGETAGPAPLAGLGGKVDALTVGRAEPIDTQAALDAAAANSPQSMGAAASAQRVNSLSPRMQQGFREAVQSTGGAVNREAAINHAEADQHGVQLMEGQATRDADQFSREQNSTRSDIVKRINDQNTQMTDALDNIRREASPGAVQNNPIENGQIALDSLKTYDEGKVKEIDQAYTAARDAYKKESGGQDLQMNGSQFVKQAQENLKAGNKTKFLPSTVQSVMDEVTADGGKLSYNDWEANRTILANEVRKADRAGDGNAKNAIGAVRDALENTEPIGASATVKPLFDNARKLAKTRFDEIRDDPAYEAAVEDPTKKGRPSPLADQFLDKYALGTAPKENVDRMMSKLDPEAQQAVAAHTLSAIRRSAIPASGTITPTGYNNALAKYGPKLGSLVSPDTQESLESLGRVIHNAKTPPPGHFVNYSKSGVIVNAAQGVGEAAINAHTYGLGVPVVKNISEGRWAKRTLKPGAGLDKLPQSGASP